MPTSQHRSRRTRRRHAAAVALDCTRNAHTWRWPIPESIERACSALAPRGVPMGVVSNASGQIEEVLRRSGVCQVGAGPNVRDASDRSTAMSSGSPSRTRGSSTSRSPTSTASIARASPTSATR